MRRWLLAVVLVALATAALLGFTVATEPGLRLAFAAAAHLGPGELSAASLRGRLIGPLELEGLRYRNGESAAAIDKLLLDWRPARLFRGILHVTRLHAAKVRVTLSPAEDQDDGQPPDLRFPLVLVLQDTAITDVAVARDGEPAPLVIDQIALDSRYDAAALRIDALQVLAPAFRISAQGSIGTQAPHAVRIDTRWSAAATDPGPWQGSGQFGGTLQELTFVQVLDQPVAAQAEGTLHEPLHRLRWQARLTLPATDLRALRPTAPALPVSAMLEGQGDLAEWRISGKATAVQETLGEVGADLRIARRADRWSIERLAVTHPASGGQIAAHGSWTTQSGTPAVELQGEWQDLAWPLAADDPVIGAPRGTFTLRGTIDDYALQANARVAGQHVPAGEWTVTAAGHRAGLSITKLHARLLDGTLEGTGTVGWQPALSWALDLKGQGLNPGSAWPAWPGDIALDAQTAGGWRDGRLTADAAIDRARGTLRDYPFDLLGRLKVDGDRFHLAQIQLHSGSARLTASGSVADTWNLEWKLAAPDLNALLPATGGTLNGTGKITGARPAPRLDAAFTGRDIAVRDLRLARLQGTVAAGPPATGASSIELDVQGLRRGTQAFDRVRLRGHGVAERHELVLSAQGGSASVETRIAGGLGPDLWRGRLVRADLSTTQYGRWTLREPAALRIGGDHTALEQACWTQGDAAACAALQWDPRQGLRADMKLTRLPLTLLQPLLPPQTSLTGALDGAASGSYHQGRLRFKANLNPGTGTFRYAVANEQAQVEFRAARLDAAADGNGLRARLTAAVGGAGGIDSVVELPRFNSDIPFPRQPLAGRMELTFRELGVIPAFFPEMDNTAGTVQIDLTLGGSVSEPRITGRATLRDGTAELPRFGVHLQDIALEAHSDGDAALRFSASARSGDGTVRLQGRALLDAAQGWPIEAELQGERFLAMNTAEAHILVSPDLRLRTQDTRATVEGTLHIPEAKLERANRRQVVQVSPDVVIIDGQGAGEEPARRAITSRVRITLGDKVHFSGFGLTGRVTGALLVTEEPGKAPTGNGELRIVDGKYEAYGQELEIGRGRLIFAASPIDNPALDVLATRRSRPTAEAESGVVAGIQVRGRVKSPEVTLVSEPPLPESDILAYLLLGQPMTQASVTEGKILTDAAGSLGLKGGAFLAKRIGAAFGIEDVHVEEGTTPEETSVVLGTYLSPRLYIGYGLGLAESVNSLRIRYELSRRWILQTRTGLQSGADLLYSIER